MNPRLVLGQSANKKKRNNFGLLGLIRETVSRLVVSSPCAK